MNEPRYHLSIGGKQIEGLSQSEVRAHLRADPAGAVQALAWTDGWPDWLPASQAFAQAGPSPWDRVVRIVPDFLHATDSGVAFQRAGAMLLRVFAVLAGVGGLVWWVFGWKEIFEASARGVVAGILPQVIIALAVYAMVRVFWIRAGQVAVVSAGPGMASRVFAVVLRGWGDAALFHSSIRGAAILLMVIVGGREHPRLAWGFGSVRSRGDYGEIVLEGLSVFGVSVGIGLFVWFVAHVVADMIVTLHRLGVNAGQEARESARERGDGAAA